MTTRRLQNAVAQAGTELRTAGLLKPQDLPTLLLACEYAAALDAAEGPVRAVILKELGPRLHETLAALGMNPAGRTKLVGKDAPAERPPAKSTRDVLAERRANRQQRAAGSPP